MKTPYVLMTLKEYNAMVAALIAYQEQHQDCTCRACQYAYEVKIEAPMPAPIFMPPSLPWAETPTS
jgi:hypothetical protein